MESIQGEDVYADLPHALVEQLVQESNQFANQITGILAKINTDKEKLHDTLEDKKMIQHESTICKVPQDPTTAGTDGSYAVDKLLAADFVAVAAVAVEGLTPPKLDEPIWPRPWHFVKTMSLPHNYETNKVVPAIQFCMETQLANLAPHDVVFLDGSVSTLSINLSVAASALDKVNKTLANYFVQGDEPVEGREVFGPLKKTLESYKQILSADRTDKISAYLPKSSQTNDVCDKLGLKDLDDKAMLSLVLKPGEFTEPINMKAHTGNWLPNKYHNHEDNNISSLAKDIENLLGKTCVFYYKPFQYFPALRIEMGRAIADNTSRLAMLLEAIKRQSGAPGVMEPYPQFMADKMVKSLSTALPAIKKQATMEVAKRWTGDPSDVYLATHSYRTEGFRS